MLTELSLLLKLTEKVERLEKLSAFNKEVLTPEEAAAYMGVEVKHIYKLTGGKHPELRSSRPTGKLIFIKKEDLIEFLMKNPRMIREEMEKESDVKSGRAAA